MYVNIIFLFIEIMICLILCLNFINFEFEKKIIFNFLLNKNKDFVFYENVCIVIIGYKNYRNVCVNGFFVEIIINCC